MEWSDTMLSLWFSRWGPKNAKNMSPTPLHHWQPELLIQGRMDRRFHVVCAKFWSYHPNVETRFSDLLMSRHGEPCWTAASLYVISWQKWHHKAFSPRKLLLSGWFLFFRPFSINPRDACVGKSQQISSFCNSSPSSPTTMPRSRSLKSAFSCILMPCLNFSRSSWLCRRAWGPAKRLAG